MRVIEVNHLTKDYHPKGIFDISFHVNKGEVLGFLGPNGSGKTTTIRHMMGFIRADSGHISIFGKDCFFESQKIMDKIGYLPGEITFMNDMTGIEFIRFMASMKKVKDFSKAKELIDFLELDPLRKIKKMSKGMKQKIAIIIAFMQDAPVLILDEPTSGLDPLMQNKFVELIQKEKRKGKTILMSSHIFEEVENTCDRVIMIKNGKIIADESIQNIGKNKYKHYEIIFSQEKDAIEFMNKYKCYRHENRVSIVQQGNISNILNEVSQYFIQDITIRSQSLEEMFLNYYGDNYDNTINQKRT